MRVAPYNLARLAGLVALLASSLARGQTSDTHVHEAMVESPFNSFVLFDELETREADGEDVLAWDIDAWFGRELHRLWLRSEGARIDGASEHADLELLWGKSFAPWWTFVAGARREFDPGPASSSAAIGVRGTTPYGFEIEATAYAGEGGRAALRFEVEHEILVTNRLIATPSLDVDWHGRGDPARGRGPGLASAELALRLRYEIRREIAPYVGLERAKMFGATADLAQAAGVDDDETRWVLGLRFWF